MSAGGLRGRGPVLAIILTSHLMILLDISIVITALPKIQFTRDFSATGLSWVISASLTAGAALLALAPAVALIGRPGKAVPARRGDALVEAAPAASR